jgi:hypothetical protein
MDYYNGRIVVTKWDLCGGDEPILSKSQYSHLIERKKIFALKRGGGLKALYDYYSLPEHVQKKYEAMRGKPEDVMKEEPKVEWIPINKQAMKFFEEFRFRNKDKDTLPEEKKAEYTNNASMLDELIRQLGIIKTRQSAMGIKKMGVAWDNLMNLVEKYRYRDKQVWHTLPTNLTNLKQKISQYKREGYSCLISGKFGNENTVKITASAGKYLIALKRSVEPVFTNEQIFERYNHECEARGWEALKSPNSVTSFLNRKEVKPLWYDAVEGELASRMRYIRNNKTILPSSRDVLWYGDGTKLNLYYKEYVKGEGWKLCTKFVYEVMDSYSEMLLGYHISDSENWEAQYNAFRMAIERSKAKPFEVVTDNQGGSKTKRLQDFLKKICRVSHATQPYNAPSKTIENAFYRFQSQVLHQWAYFTGQNITAKNGRPNMELIQANIEKVPTLDEMMETYRQAREMWNGERAMLTTTSFLKHPKEKTRTRVEVYESSPQTCEEIDYLDMIEMFWQMTEKPSTFTASGITIQVNNKRYSYEPLNADGLPDMEFRRKHTGRKFFVQYDPNDMTRVRLFVKEATGMRYVATADTYLEIHRAINDQTEGERSLIIALNDQAIEERVRRQLEVADIEEEYGMSIEDKGWHRPRIKGVSSKKVEAIMQGVSLYDGACEEVGEEYAYNDALYETASIGQYEKAMSLMTYDDVDRFDKL